MIEKFNDLIYNIREQKKKKERNMAQDVLTFKKGVHIDEFKELSENSNLLVLEVPKQVVIPLTQHIGAPSKCLVNKKDEVAVGQLIGQAVGNFSANIHSSVAGVVTDIIDIQTASGKNAQAVVIDTEGFDQNKEYILNEHVDLSKEEIVSKIKDAGIVGMGGAAFPTHIKYTPPKPIDTVIVNGAECEPYVTCDDYILKNKPEAIVKGLSLLVKAVDAKEGIVAIEDNKPKAYESITNYLKNYEAPVKLRVVKLATKYPQGDEKRIIDAVLHRHVPSGGLPMDVGVNVSNVSSVNAVYEAIYYDKPLYERIMTVTGHNINKPTNMLVKIGTAFEYAIDQAAGTKGEIGKIINGGPMMGIAQPTNDKPIEKATNCILVQTKEEAIPQVTEPCIRCARCVEVCPVNLMPLYIHKFALKEKLDMAESYRIMDCIECGSCSYICPSKRPLVEAIRFGKRQIRQAGK